jgi:hypothetical protein
MDRTQFYTTVTVDGIDEKDFLWNPLSGFVMHYQPMQYRVTTADLAVPDSISYNCYGQEDFWWIILLVNNISDPFTELVAGQILLIPNRLDIYDFVKKFKVV